jgi:hypothetical protein
VADARRIRAVEQSAARTEARQLFDRGLAAEAAGRPAAARLYYQSAARQADEPLAAEVRTRLEALKSAPGSSR